MTLKWTNDWLADPDDDNDGIPDDEGNCHRNLMNDESIHGCLDPDNEVPDDDDDDEHDEM